jgi:hypothetical protein
MKIARDLNKAVDIQPIEVTSATHIDDFVIGIFFNDGTERLIDFKPFLFKSLHPSISKYKNETLFKQFQIIDGNLNWNDFDLIFPIDNLHKGIID